MSIPEPMPCLLDACPSPTACHFAGHCRERQKDAYRSWGEALAACREAGIADPFRRDEGSARND